MNKHRHKLNIRKKVIPHHFMKRKVPLSQILTTASYKIRVRELLKNNKALASALQDSQCTISDNNKVLQNYTEDQHQVLFAKMKVKEMAITIQKLVKDLNAVITCLDSCRINVKPSFDDLKVRIQQSPNLETIDESVRSSLDGEAMTECSYSKNVSVPVNESLKELGIEDKLYSCADSSITEIYNVQQFILNEPEKQEAEKVEVGIALKEPQMPSSPATPEFHLPADVTTSNFLTRKKGQDQSPLIQSNTTKNSSLPSTEKLTSIGISKIPLLKHNLFPETSNLHPPHSIQNENRRETFVVTQSSNLDHSNCLQGSSLRRETFTLNEIHNELACKKSYFDKRGTFVINTEAPPCSILNKDINEQQNSVTNQTPLICEDDKTVFFSEDMELTEIIPSNVISAVAKTFENKETNADLGNFLHPAILKNKEEIKVCSSKASKPTIKTGEPISPILKVKSPISDTSGDKLEILPKTPLLGSAKDAKNNLKSDLVTVSSDKAVEEIKTSAKKSILPSFINPPGRLTAQDYSNNCLNEVNVNTDLNVDNNISEKYSSVLNSETENLKLISSSKKETVLSPICTVNESPLKKSISKVSSVLPKKSIPSKTSETSSDLSLSYSSSSDNDPDFTEKLSKLEPRPRIPGRKSLRPNRRKPFVFTKPFKSSKQPCKTDEQDIAASHSNDLKASSYDFSSSESEEETTKKGKPSKTVYKKSIQRKNEKSTVALLERDINFKFQDQSRKKRSLKRKVSFACANSPTNSDSEKGSKTFEVQIFPDNESKTVHAFRPSILKKRQSTIPCPLLMDENMPSEETIHNKQSDSKNAYESVTQSPKKYDSKSTKQVAECGDLPYSAALTSADKELNCEKVWNNATCHEEESKAVYERKKRSSSIEISLKPCSLQHKISNNNSKENTELHKNKTKFIDKSEELNLLNNTVNKNMNEAKSNSDDNFFVDKECILTEGNSKNLRESKIALKNKTSSLKNSDSLGFGVKISLDKKSKRTFSGVSERSSKKRYTVDDDFLEDAEMNIISPDRDSSPQGEKNKNPEHPHKSIENTNKEVLNSLDPPRKKSDKLKSMKELNKIVEDVISRSSCNKEFAAMPEQSNAQKRNENTQTKKLDKNLCANATVERDIKVPQNSKSKKSKTSKSKRKTNSEKDDLTQRKVSSLDQYHNEGDFLRESNAKELSHSPSASKSRKTSSVKSTKAAKENIEVADTENTRRCRRSKPVNYREPSGIAKMRRE